MFSIRSVSAVFLLFAAFSAGCRQASQRSAMPQESARAVAASASVAAQASLPQREAPPTNTQQMSQTFTVVAHNKRVPGKQGDFAQALASLDIADAVGAISDGVKIGKGLAEPLVKTKVFPPLAVHLVRAGEEGACQEDMLIRIADIFDREVQRSTERLLALISPAVTIVMGMVVALVIGSVLTAILSVYELTG